MNTEKLNDWMSAFWDTEILPSISEYITIPNESPAFDKEWAAHGHMDKAVKLVTDWMNAQQVPGMKVSVLKDGGRTPLVLAEVPGNRPETVLIYGHLDKQPPMTGWRDDLGPWKPVLDEKGRLYGRGGADDGYAAYAAVAAVKALKASGQPHGRILMLIECSEESGSHDLPHYVKTYRKEIGEPDLIVCLDSGCGNYEQLWSTTSLRGLMVANITVGVLKEGVHSGMAGGIVPNPMLIMRQLMDRLEDPATGRLIPDGLHVEIPEARLEQARTTAHVLGGAVSGDLPLLPGVHPLSDDTVQLLLNDTWEPALAVIGQKGLPEPGQSGNVLIPELTWRVSLRVPPTLSPADAAKVVKAVLEKDPPFGAKISVSVSGEPGWNAPPLAPWLQQVSDEASREFYGKEACYFGIGGSIPFMAMMGDAFPKAQFLITGVLGPNSNAHGPNEFLHVPYAKKLNACIVRVIQAHYDYLGS